MWVAVAWPWGWRGTCLLGLEGQEDDKEDGRGYREETRGTGTSFGQHGCVIVPPLLFRVRFVVIRE